MYFFDKRVPMVKDKARQQIVHKPRPVAALPTTHQNRMSGKILSLSRPLLEKLLHFPELNDIYTRTINDTSPRPFCERLLSAMNVRYDVPSYELERIPAIGGAIAIANHPFGGIEAAAFVALLQSVRSDVRILSNHFLRCVPELHDVCIFVDPFGSLKSQQSNIRPVADAIRWVRNGGLLAIFPAGEVSHLKLDGKGITDPKWPDSLGRIVRLAKAPVVPLYFSGSNSLFFQFSGLLHSRIRTLLLPREFVNKKNKTIEVAVGHPIDFRKLAGFDDIGELTEYLRTRTYLLKNKRPISRDQNEVQHTIPIVESRGISELCREIDLLPDCQMLLSSGDHIVFFFRSSQAPNLMYEIGRCREVTFRAAGEGTGQPMDLDEFDEHYVQLVLWNRARSEIVGAYRMGHTDEIIDMYGVSGLYTSTLFSYKPQFIDAMRNALELGRSFVMPVYQRSFSSLLLLWKGIGRYVIRNPHYRFLFGPVSIDNNYHRFSQLLMVRFLEENNLISENARYVEARRPFRDTRRVDRNGRPFASLMHDIDDLSSLICDFEDEKRGVPILLRQYLKLGGKLLGFNVDDKFNNVLDGLILVDLTKTDERTLSRYMGERYTDFLALHREQK